MRKLFQEDSPSRLVMSYALFFGGFPYDSLVYLAMSGTPQPLQKAVSRLTRQRYLETTAFPVAKRKVKFTAPTWEAVRWASDADDFFDAETRKTLINRSSLLRGYIRKPYDARGVTQASLKVMRNELMRALCGSGAAMFLSRVYMLLGGSGLMRHVYPRLGAHPFDPNADTDPDSGTIGEPSYIFSYYPTQEAKAFLNEEERRAASGRAVGYITAGCGNWQVYLLENKAAKVSQNAELRTFFLMSQVLKKNTGRGLTATLIIARYIDLIRSLIMPKAGGLDLRDQEDFMRINFTDPPTYFVPETQEGAAILSLLLYDGGIGILTKLLCDGTEVINTRGIDCDYIKDGAYVLNFLVPDIVRLKKFIVNCSTFSDLRFRIICFEPFRRLLEGLFYGRGNVAVESYGTLDIYERFRRKAVSERTDKGKGEAAT